MPGPTTPGRPGQAQACHQADSRRTRTLNSYPIEQAATQHTAEVRATSAATVKARRTRGGDHHPIRRRTGWVLVSVGLWLACGRAPQFSSRTSHAGGRA
jgi:hypothetical protein